MDESILRKAAKWIWTKRNYADYWNHSVLTRYNPDPTSPLIDKRIAFQIFTILEERKLMLPITVTKGNDIFSAYKINFNKEKEWKYLISKKRIFDLLFLRTIKPFFVKHLKLLVSCLLFPIIVCAIVVFVFQPWQQKIQKNVKEDVVERNKVVHQGQKLDAASSFQDRLSFIEAAKEGNVSVIESLLNKGVDVNTIDRDGNTALIEATRHNQRACIQKLIEKGSKVDAKNSDGWTALIIASQNGHKAVVELLIKNGADVNVKASNGSTAFVFASYEGYDEIVDILKKSGAVSVKYPDPKILLAALKGDINTLKALLEKGVSPNTIGRIGGETPLMYAMGQNNIECAKLLLEFGADVDIRANDGHTVFDDIKGKPEMLELIEKYGTKRQ